MKNIIIVDDSRQITDIIQSITFVEKVDIKIFESAKKFAKSLKGENNDLVFLSLEVSDVNEFLIHDILKKCHQDPRTPIYICYDGKRDISEYRELKLKPDEYLLNPVSEDKVKQLVMNYVKVDPRQEDPREESGETFRQTDNLFDQLIRQQVDITPGSNEKKDKGIFTVHDGTIDKQLEELEKMKVINRELKTANRELNDKLKKHKENGGEGVKALKDSLEKEKKAGEERITDLREEIKEREARYREAVENWEKERNRIRESVNEDVDRKKEEIEKMKKDFQLMEDEYIEKISTLSEQIKKNSETLKEMKEIEESQQLQLEEKEEVFTTLKKELESSREKVQKIEKKASEKEQILISSIEKQKEEIRAKEDRIRRMREILEGFEELCRRIGGLNKTAEG